MTDDKNGFFFIFTTVESNETLYSNEPKFLQEISVISQTVLNQILSFFESTSDKVRRLIS